MKQPVVALSAPQKPYHPSPVQDSKRCGFGGLLSRPAVHAASRDEEDRSSSAVLRNLWREEEEVLVRLSGRSDLPFIGAREGCSVRIQYPLQQKLSSSRVTFRIPVVRGKNLDIGSAHSRNPRRVVTRRGEARRGVAWRGGRRRRSARGCPSCSHAHTSGEGASLIKRSNSL